MLSSFEICLSLNGGVVFVVSPIHEDVIQALLTSLLTLRSSQAWAVVWKCRLTSNAIYTLNFQLGNLYFEGRDELDIIFSYLL